MKIKIGIIGLGYVGLPLAVELGKYFQIIAFDINKKRINELNNNKDVNNDYKKQKISNKNIKFTSNQKYLQGVNFFIITVPTPIYKNKKPNLNFIKKASLIVSEFLTNKSVVVYESTVYPGLTENYALPILKRKNKLNCPTNDQDEKLLIKNKKDLFYLGYSPERVNPGDKKRNLKNITKIISSNVDTGLKNIFNVYKKIIKSKIYKVKNIKIAEAAKIIENTQRDLNIALFNELSIIFNKLNLDSKKIFDAAETKWNFHRYYPGLVGGHCIGVDPYYLTHLSLKKNYKPKVILSGRSVNDNMHNYIFTETKKIFSRKKIDIKKSRILFLGYTFKENCSDIRNSRSLELAKRMSKFCKSINLFDPEASPKLKNTNKIKILNSIKGKFDLIIVVVKHNKFKKYTSNFFRSHLKKNSIFIDLFRHYNGRIKTDFSL